MTSPSIRSSDRHFTRETRLRSVQVGTSETSEEHVVHYFRLLNALVLDAYLPWQASQHDESTAYFGLARFCKKIIDALSADVCRMV